MKIPVKRKSFADKEWADRIAGLAALERAIIPAVQTKKVDGKKIKADTFYVLVGGKFKKTE